MNYVPENSNVERSNVEEGFSPLIKLPLSMIIANPASSQRKTLLRQTASFGVHLDQACPTLFVARAASAEFGLHAGNMKSITHNEYLEV